MKDEELLDLSVSRKVLIDYGFCGKANFASSLENNVPCVWMTFPNTTGLQLLLRNGKRIVYVLVTKEEITDFVRWWHMAQWMRHDYVGQWLLEPRDEHLSRMGVKYVYGIWPADECAPKNISEARKMREAKLQ